MPSVPALALDCELRSETGRRPNNEDSLFASSRVAVVADGVGGADAGESLVSLALAAGANDNVSLVVADVVPRRHAGDAWRC